MSIYKVKSDGTGVIPRWVPFLALFDNGFENNTDLLRVKLPSNLK